MCEQFVASVKEYIALIEGLSQSRPHNFLSRCARVLPQIYSLGQSLPDVDIPDEENKNFIDEIPSPMSLIGKLLGKHDFYMEVFDPVYDKDTVMASLSDDLADIYLDLKRPLLKFETKDNNSQNIALWEWKFNIQGHCGDHIVDALRPIHRLVFDHLSSDI
jgi:hypothetical protein